MLLQLLGLLTGVIQAYIFAVLAMVYIASASGAEPGAAENQSPRPPIPPTQTGASDAPESERTR